MAGETIAVVYCGSRFTRVLVEKLMGWKTQPVMVPHYTPIERLLPLDLRGIIITGSPHYVNSPKAPKIDQGIYDCGIPVLGVCYGMQRMAVDLGGRVKRMLQAESGACQLETEGHPESVLYADFMEEGAPVWMAHTCKTVQMPVNFVCTGSTTETEIASMENAAARLYAVQYHPEHVAKEVSQAGDTILWRFLHDVCGCEWED